MRSTLASQGEAFACAQCAADVPAPRAWGPGGSVLCEGCARRPENVEHARAYLAARLAFLPPSRVPASSSSSSSPVRRCHACGAHADVDDAAATLSLRWFCQGCRPAPLRVCGRCSLPIVPGESFAAGADRLPVHVRCRDLIAELRAANEGTDVAAAPAALVATGHVGELAEVSSHEDLERARFALAATLSRVGGGD